MHAFQLKQQPTLAPNFAQAGKTAQTAKLLSLQTKAKLGKSDDLSAVSNILKAQYKRSQSAKLQAEPTPEEEKQGQQAQLQAEPTPEEEEKQGKGFDTSQASKSKLQGKADWQKKANLSNIFGGSGSRLSNGLMGKYQKLMPGISLGHVQVFQGASVDQALHQAGLQGLTDGTRVAVSSKAQAGTLEHELGHVAQRQVQGFNLNESSREGYEQDADSISASLVNNQTVQFPGLTQGKTPSNQAQQSNILAAKCADCQKEQQPKQLLAKTISISGKGQLQASWLDSYWTEYVNCTVSGIGWLTSATLLLMKECGAAIGQQIVNVLIVPLIGLLERVGGGNNDTNPFGWLTGILYAIWHFLNILKGGLQATVVCITALVGIVASLIGFIWCIISAVRRIRAKIEQKKRDAKTQAERDALQRQVNDADQKIQQLEGAVNQLQQEQNALKQQQQQQQRTTP